MRTFLIIFLQVSIAECLYTKVAPIIMKIALLQTGKTTEKHIAEGVDIYSARIRKYSGFEIITLPDIKNTRNMPEQEQKLKGGEKDNETAVGKMILLFCLMKKGKSSGQLNLLNG